MSPIAKPNIHDPSRPLRATVAVLALGSNLGDRRATILAAIDEINEIRGVTVTKVSDLIESVAVKLTGEDPDAPGYVNAVIAVSTVVPAHRLLRELQRIENEHGRVREERWGDRTLDIDIVVYGSLQKHDASLTLPHPRAADRTFVLEPWLEIDADASIPGVGRVDAILAELRRGSPS